MRIERGQNTLGSSVLELIYALSYVGGHAAIAHGQKERVCVNTGIVYIPRLNVYVMYVLALCGHCSERGRSLSLLN